MKTRENIWYKIIILFAVVVAVNFLASQFMFSFDLTDDKRHTLSDETIRWIEIQESPILAEVLFAGDFPAGYKRLQATSIDLLKKLRLYNSNLKFVVKDPMQGEESLVETRMEEFARAGLVPIPIRYESGTEFIARQTFPYIVFTKGQKRVIVNLIEGLQTGPYDEEKLNEAVAALEYKFANAFQKLMQVDRRKIGFHTGKGELSRQATFRLEQELSKFYQIGRFSLDTIDFIDPDIDVIVFAGPRQNFLEKELFAIDRYVMEGGNIVWLIDPLQISMDSIARLGQHITIPYDLGLENLFFKYGVRIQNELILDLEAASVPLVTAMISGEPQIELFSWYYFPLISGDVKHPMLSGVDRVFLQFPSPLDTVRTDGDVRKSIIMTSSSYTRTQTTPATVSLEILRYPADHNMFNKGYLNVAVLLEGNFPSFFTNRLGASYLDLLQSYGLEIKNISENSKQLIVTDADFIVSMLNQSTGELFPIGYNMGERKTYEGNKTFALNAFEYMMGNGSLLTLKNKKLRLRLFDRGKVLAERKKWQWVNTGAPVIFVLLIGLLFYYVRKRKYQQPLT